ncbi:bromodomain-containing protein [Pycnococcus provasolii]
MKVPSTSASAGGEGGEGEGPASLQRPAFQGPASPTAASAQPPQQQQQATTAAAAAAAAHTTQSIITTRKAKALLPPEEQSAAAGATPPPTKASKNAAARSQTLTQAQPPGSAPPLHEFPSANAFLDALATKLTAIDSDGFFAAPVTDEIAPGYSAVVSRPMDLGTIRTKLSGGTYTHWNQLNADFDLMCNNAFAYNDKKSVVHRAALNLQRSGKRILQLWELQGRKALAVQMNERGIAWTAPDVTASTDRRVDVGAKNDPFTEEIKAPVAAPPSFAEAKAAADAAIAAAAGAVQPRIVVERLSRPKREPSDPQIRKVPSSTAAAAAAAEEEEAAVHMDDDDVRPPPSTIHDSANADADAADASAEESSSSRCCTTTVTNIVRTASTTIIRTSSTTSKSTTHHYHEIATTTCTNMQREIVRTCKACTIGDGDVRYGTSPSSE